ncbi:hypothetical protein O1L55_27050 [Streptomyces albulus]|nr:hypothetical protein [Streptomyces noursei]
MGTLATSAAFVEEPLPVAYGAALLATLGVAEVRWGTARAATVFAAGHIGASLLVYAGLRARRGDGTRPAPRAPGGDGGTAHALDVGASYGFTPPSARWPRRCRTGAPGRRPPAGCWRWARCRWSAAAGRSPTSDT